ncbi:TPA: D-tyrosyl-tRNA(Tyr) deacylase [Candidatus Ventrenecus avicola]|nr:D-tyrosyl-tRNA(Tyr) deacylase [Candidatus Ventrenecus avicola]
MRAVVQRAQNAQVVVDDCVVGNISFGLVILVGFTEGDGLEQIKKMVHKVLNLRIFPDDNGVMNRSVLDVEGKILSVSQFTLYADTKKGNRPSYIKALNGEEAKKLYDLWNVELAKEISVETGVFGADMNVTLTNVGPTTIWLEME